MNFDELRDDLVRRGCVRLLVKRLSVNDDSKKQIYLGQGFGVLNQIPSEMVAHGADGTIKQPHAKFRLSWLSESGQLAPAPHAKLILYPQYPEVRMSGFLRGCPTAPVEVLAPGAGKRYGHRFLMLGVTAAASVIGFVWTHNDLLARFSEAAGFADGVFTSIPLTNKTARTILLERLSVIAAKGWIDAKRLTRSGVGPCTGQNCGGYTLEAELGIAANGLAEPDFMGWEVKQHGERALDAPTSAVITLFTPEPTAGIYAASAAAFVRRFGYPALDGTPDRLNFGGIFRVGKEDQRTGLTLALVGAQSDGREGFAEGAAVQLVTRSGEVAAGWPLIGLLGHWNRKHSLAAYVPSIRSAAPHIRYRYGNKVRLGQGTSFSLVLRAIQAGAVYLDPGIKLEGASSSNPRMKRRNQFRVRSSMLQHLYTKMEQVVLL